MDTSACICAILCVLSRKLPAFSLLKMERRVLACSISQVSFLLTRVISWMEANEGKTLNTIFMDYTSTAMAYSKLMYEKKFPEGK